MKGRVVALGEIQGRKAAVSIVDGRLDDFLIDPDDDAFPAPGTIFRAICERPLKGQGGMIVRLPDGSGYLRGAKGLRPGRPLLVQVTGYAEKGKAVPVTTRLLFKSKYAIVTPGAPGINVSRTIKDEETRVRLLDVAHDVMTTLPELGLIVRSSAAGAGDDEIAEDIAAMRDVCMTVLCDLEGPRTELLVDGPDPHNVAWRDWSDSDVFADGPTAFDDHGVSELIEDLKSPRVGLSGGGFAYIEPTRALVAIDVNTGGDTSTAAGLKANIALARDLPRQLRSRGLGGQITIDFAPLAKKDRSQLEHILKAAFRGDAMDTALCGWTPLGHFELQRKRERLPIAGYL